MDCHRILSQSMPSIFKRSDSPFYVCSFVAADGRRLKKSTKTTDRRKALEFCLLLEKAAMKARRNELTLAQGRKLIAEMVTISSGEQLAAHTVRGWFEEWLENKTTSAGQRTTARYRQVLNDFLTHLGSRADAPLTAISPRDIISFRDRLRAEGRTARTTNNLSQRLLSLPFSSALRLGHIAANPCAAVDPINDRAETRASGREPFMVDEVAALVAHADGDWKGAIILGATSGLRLSDIANLRWEALDLEAGLLRLQTQKTDAVVVAPLHGNFLTWLDGRPRGIGKASVFPALTGQSTAGHKGLSAQFADIMRKAGVTGRVSERRGPKGRKRNSKSYHSLRHHFVSQLANLGVAPDVRQKLAGHSSAAVHGIYSHHEIETLRAAIARLPALGDARS
jgi:integrase